MVDLEPQLTLRYCYRKLHYLGQLSIVALVPLKLYPRYSPKPRVLLLVVHPSRFPYSDVQGPALSVCSLFHAGGPATVELVSPLCHFLPDVVHPSKLPVPVLGSEGVAVRLAFDWVLVLSRNRKKRKLFLLGQSNHI